MGAVVRHAKPLLSWELPMALNGSHAPCCTRPAHHWDPLILQGCATLHLQWACHRDPQQGSFAHMRKEGDGLSAWAPSAWQKSQQY